MRRLWGYKGKRAHEGDEKNKEFVTQKKEPGLGLQILSQPSDNSKIIVDIVLVHGLTGSSRDTWLDRKAAVHWPTTILCQDMPDARILAFGYDADVVNFWNPTSQNRTGNHAENMLGDLSGLREETDSEDRKIIFIAHSLGGLITENALCISNTSAEKHIRQVGTCTIAIAFLGTPHFGSDHAGWAEFGTKIAKIVKHANKNIVSILKPGSEMLAVIQKRFHNILRLRAGTETEIAITCFYEELAVSVIGEIVPKHSAILPGYPSYGIHSNHMDMARFSSSDDIGYKGILREIRRWVKPLRQAVLESDHDVEPSLSADEIKCLQCLYHSDYEAHRKRNPDRVQGTCEWFLQHEKYQHWLQEQKSSLLWVSADPGCGKSVLASFLVNKLRDQESQTALSGTVCFFFFKDDNNEQNKATFALRALLHQLFTVKNSLIKYAMMEFQHKNEKFIDEFNTLWKILIMAAADADCGNMICVIDGLDECEELSRAQLIRSWMEFYMESSANEPFLKFIITSRPYLSIETEFDDLYTIRLKAEDESDATENDIEMVVKAKVQTIGRKRGLSNEVQSTLIEHLINNADRTFLWVSLILADLEKSVRVSKSALDDLLSTLPKTLDAIYEKILRKCPNRGNATRLLHIVIAAVRPLSLKEMNVAFTIKPADQSEEDLDLEPSIGDTVKNLCGLFVKVIDSRIYLVHQTAREFLSKSVLLSIDASSIPRLWKHSLDPTESNLILAERCLWYLLFPVFENHPLVIDPGSERSQAGELVSQYTTKHDFLEYAAGHWDTHLNRAGVNENVTLLKSASEVCDTRSKRFMTWFHVFYFTHAYQFTGAYQQCPQPFTNLMAASFFGQQTLVKQLLENEVAMESKDNVYSRTALWWAASNGHEEVVKLLLENGADANSKDHLGHTPIWSPIFNKNEMLVRLLLDNGADVKFKDNIGCTAIWWAVYNGNTTMVRLLLDHGADVESRDHNGKSLLEWAAFNHDKMMIELLHENGADMESKGDFGPTALHMAAFENDETAVKLLLEHGADVNSNDGSHQTPLLYAIERGHDVVVKLLLEHGADMESKFDSGPTALHMAAFKNDETAVKLLLEHGADVNSNDGSHRTPLLYAIARGHDVVVKLLLENGADLESKSDIGQTVLHHAAANNNEMVPKLLLEHGADVTSRNNQGQTALLQAAVRNNEMMVKVLLENGADVESKDNHGQTAMQVAARYGHEATVKLLLEHGADVDSKDIYEYTPLQNALDNGQDRVVKLLLESGAGLESKNYEGQTAMQLAVFKDNKTIVKLLLERGADVNSKDIHGHTPLNYAIAMGHDTVAKLLLENGTDPGIPTASGALHETAGTPAITLENSQIPKGPAGAVGIHQGASGDEKTILR